MFQNSHHFLRWTNLIFWEALSCFKRCHLLMCFWLFGTSCNFLCRLITDYRYYPACTGRFSRQWHPQGPDHWQKRSSSNRMYHQSMTTGLKVILRISDFSCLLWIYNPKTFDQTGDMNAEIVLNVFHWETADVFSQVTHFVRLHVVFIHRWRHKLQKDCYHVCHLLFERCSKSPSGNWKTICVKHGNSFLNIM